MDYLSLDEPTELRVSRAVDSRGTRENPLTIKYQESFLIFLIGYVRVFDRLQLYFNFCWK